MGLDVCECGGLLWIYLFIIIIFLKVALVDGIVPMVAVGVVRQWLLVAVVAAVVVVGVVDDDDDREKLIYYFNG